MKAVSLFTGVGGFELGLAAAGHEMVLMCENWAPARAVLDERFSAVPKHGDVRDLTSLPADADLLSAGFPCQDLSQAGRTAGISAPDRAS